MEQTIVLAVGLGILCVFAWDINTNLCKIRNQLAALIMQRYGRAGKLSMTVSEVKDAWGESEWRKR